MSDNMMPELTLNPTEAAQEAVPELTLTPEAPTAHAAAPAIRNRTHTDGSPVCNTANNSSVIPLFSREVHPLLHPLTNGYSQMSDVKCTERERLGLAASAPFLGHASIADSG